MVWRVPGEPAGARNQVADPALLGHLPRHVGDRARLAIDPADQRHLERDSPEHVLGNGAKPAIEGVAPGQVAAILVGVFAQRVDGAEGADRKEEREEGQAGVLASQVGPARHPPRAGDVSDPEEPGVECGVDRRDARPACRFLVVPSPAALQVGEGPDGLPRRGEDTVADVPEDERQVVGPACPGIGNREELLCSIEHWHVGVLGKRRARLEARGDGRIVRGAVRAAAGWMNRGPSGRGAAWTVGDPESASAAAADAKARSARVTRAERLASAFDLPIASGDRTRESFMELGAAIHCGASWPSCFSHPCVAFPPEGAPTRTEGILARQDPQ